uniref:Exopolygalacturonase-like n=1 Tax=Kalanchoe fedtschenkoi TaxID=63787 RepID=A0A7N0TEJ0_KALFE
MAAEFNLNVVAIILLATCIITPARAQAQVFDITKFGAKPNADVTGALASAWKEACASATPGKIVVPKGKFILGMIKFEGPCKAPIELNVLGTLQAPSDLAAFKGADGWVVFGRIDHFTMSGDGVFDGQGHVAWEKNDCHKNTKCSGLPYNIRFNFLTNSTIKGVTTKDSKNFHVNVLGCNNFTFQNFKVSAPAESLNTDGIHIGRSTGVNITDSIIETGDDCISIGDGSRNVYIERVSCGPGHGISIGSLGRYKNEDDVSGITVKNCTLTNTDNGVRIKTWPALEPGIASDMHFEDIIMNNVSNPVLIDQEYCPWNQCKLGIPSKVKISNVSFKNIRGTTTTREAVKLICSKGFPCQNVEVGNIDLDYSGPDGPAVAVCKNLKPTVTKPFPTGCTA